MSAGSESRKCMMANLVGDFPKKVVPCENMATRYGFDRGAGGWAGPICDEHTSAVAWHESLGGSK